MTENPSPAEIAASRMSPDAVQRRLDADIAAVEGLGRRGARVDPAESESVLQQIRAQAGSIGFDSPIEAAAMSRRRIQEVPLPMLGGESLIADFHAAVTRVVADGEPVADTAAHEGGGTVVFHYTAEEAAGTTATLEAAVHVAGNGAVRLESFGWPRTRVHAPIHTFRGGTDAYLGQAAADLRHAAPHFDRGMLMLLGAAVASGTAPPADSDRAAAIAELLAGNRAALDVYVSAAEDYSLNSEHGWYGACLHRSALETAFEHFLGSAAFSLIDMEEVNGIDEELQERFADPERLPLAATPPGVPSHHWWWHPAGR